MGLLKRVIESENKSNGFKKINDTVKVCRLPVPKKISKIEKKNKFCVKCAKKAKSQLKQW